MTVSRIAARRAFTPIRIAMPPAMWKMPVAYAQKSCDGGSHFGTSGAVRFMKASEVLADIFRKNPSTLVRACFVNGLPGFVTLEADGELATTALEIEDGKIAAVYVVRNPDKLRHLH